MTAPTAPPRPALRAPAGRTERSGGVPVLRRRRSRWTLAARRLAAHLTRSTARWGYLLTALCVLGYGLVPTHVEWGDPLRQFLLVLASVAAGAIVLPELPSNLWSLDVTRVRNLVPDDQRATLAQTLVAAESDDPLWNDVVWQDAVRPLLLASREPWRYVRNMDYDVTVHLDRTVAVAGEHVRCHMVSVDSKSQRVLAHPGAGASLWISVARTERALADEFAAPGCLAREIVTIDDLTAEQWQQAVTEVCSARLFIGGEAIELDVEVAPERPDLVRWCTPGGFEVPEGWTTVRIMFDFVIGDTVDSFPVMFSGYYCAGTTDISLRLYGGSELRSEEFVGRALDDGGRPETVERSTEVFRQRSFTTGGDTILWPGSGVLYRWSR
jgi:hypothetical protein